MADNFDITPGVGKTIRSVEKGGIMTQSVVVDVGAAGAESLWNGTVNLGAVDNAVLDAMVVDLDAIKTAVEDTTAAAVSIANGADVAQGTTTDAPASTSTPQDATARTLVSLLKGLINTLILVNNKLVTGTVIGDVNLGATDNAVLDTIDAAIDAINAKLVTGTVIGDVNLGATDNAVLDTIDAALDAINAKLVTGTVIGDVNLGATDNAVLDTIDAALDAINAKLVTGTVIGDVNLGATDNAVLDTIDAALDAINAKLMTGMLEGGLTELVGINEQVDQNDYSGSVGVALGASYSGEIQSVALYATEDGTGAVQDSAGILYIFDADPSINSGDTAMSAAARVTCIGKIPVAALDWDTDANGGLAFVTTQPIPFHSVSTLYFVWKHLDATGLNDAAGDDEQLEFNFWYKRES